MVLLRTPIIGMVPVSNDKTAPSLWLGDVSITIQMLLFVWLYEQADAVASDKEEVDPTKIYLKKDDDSEQM